MIYFQHRRAKYLSNWLEKESSPLFQHDSCSHLIRMVLIVMLLVIIMMAWLGIQQKNASLSEQKFKSWLILDKFNSILQIRTLMQLFRIAQTYQLGGKIVKNDPPFEPAVLLPRHTRSLVLPSTCLYMCQIGQVQLLSFNRQLYFGSEFLIMYFKWTLFK